MRPQIRHLHKIMFRLASLILFGLSPVAALGHEVVGEVTPLMLHTQHTLTLIEHGRTEQVIKMAQKFYEDFEAPPRPGKEAGLMTSSRRVDRLFGSSIESQIARSIEDRNMDELKRSLQHLSLLLMLEKFDVLQREYAGQDSNLNLKETIFWLGRNYFSYLLEPVLAKKDPIEEKHLDRLLDRMLYSIQDSEWVKFEKLRTELTVRIVRNFSLFEENPPKSSFLRGFRD